MLFHVPKYLFMHLPRTGGTAWALALYPFYDQHTALLLGHHRHIDVDTFERLYLPIDAFIHKYLLIRNPLHIFKSVVNMLAYHVEDKQLAALIDERSTHEFFRELHKFRQYYAAKEWHRIIHLVFRSFLPSTDGSIVRSYVGSKLDQFQIIRYENYNAAFSLFVQAEYGYVPTYVPPPVNVFPHTIGDKLLKHYLDDIMPFVAYDLEVFYPDDPQSQSSTHCPKNP